MSDSPFDSAADPALPSHFAIVPAAGVGRRLGADRPKQYLDLDGATMLERTVQALLACPWIERLMVVVSLEDEVARDLTGLKDGRIRIVARGGATRRASVLGGLLELAEQCGARDHDWVWVHDAARPGVDAASLHRLHEALATERIGALLALPVADTVKRGGNQRSLQTIDREGLWLAQTPQVFGLGRLREALVRHHSVTDEASAIEANGLLPALVVGNLRNFKVTTMDDLQAMRASLALSPEAAATCCATASVAADAEAGVAVAVDAVSADGARFRIGQGWDVHALVPGRALLIGGVAIPFERGLLGHSDADVLLHAITDAMLGAAALGDIGRHFPDTDARFAGADSRVLLREALARVRAAGWVPGNIDCTVVAQAPKLASHIPAMVAAIAADLGIASSQVNVKAKTAEKLGFAGRGEGIEAHATVLLVAATQA
jgi:2-C-methyl-D-erythritol 4-phosphate cytidylyltransferase/2-C-methyl-D-erythritol 2,4-cyclodiphosphate synthase